MKMKKRRTDQVMFIVCHFGYVQGIEPMRMSRLFVLVSRSNQTKWNETHKKRPLHALIFRCCFKNEELYLDQFEKYMHIFTYSN